MRVFDTYQIPSKRKVECADDGVALRFDVHSNLRNAAAGIAPSSGVYIT